MFRGWLCAAALVLTMLGPGSAMAADAAGTITILEGEALVYRGLGRLHAQEGSRLVFGDIVETAAGGFAQIELSDHSVLQIGPATRAMLDAGNARRKPEQWIYLMNGWAKLAGAGKDAKQAASQPGDAAAAGPRYDLRAPLYEIPAPAGVLVLQTQPAEVTLFVEQGEVRLVERAPGDKPGNVTLRGGDSYVRKPGTRSVVSRELPTGFLAQMPQFFRDSLPLRIDRFRDAEPKPRPAPDFVYADVEAWLDAEPDVRRPFVKRWRPKAQDKEFRAGLVAGLAGHPEWDPILFPEKYLPKPKPHPPMAATLPPAPMASAPNAP